MVTPVDVLGFLSHPFNRAPALLSSGVAGATGVTYTNNAPALCRSVANRAVRTLDRYDELLRTKHGTDSSSFVR